MKKNTANQKIGAQMTSASNGSAFTGAVTVYVTGDAGTQAIGSVGSGACVHEGNGYHTYAPAQAETNYDLIAFTFVGTGAIATTIQVRTATKLVSELNDAPAAPSAATVAGQVRTELGTELGRIDAAISSRSTLAAGDAMTLTSGERTSIGTAVWASATRSLTTFGTLAADIATAVWAAGTRTLSGFGSLVTDIRDAILNRVLATNHETAGTLGKLAQKLDVAGTLAAVGDLPPAPLDAVATRAALGLSAANLDTQLGALPTDADVQAAAAAALAASTVPSDTAAIRAAVYDSASADGDVITLSDGATQAVSATGRVTTTP